MRSRDGNFNLLFSICTLIFCFSNLNGDEYIISYRYAIKDAILLNDSLDISRAMTPCSGEIGESKLLLSTTNDTKDLKKIILQNSELFFTYINSIGLHIRSDEVTNNGINSALTIVTLKPTCFTVEFNDNLVKIAPFK